MDLKNFYSLIGGIKRVLVCSFYLTALSVFTHGIRMGWRTVRQWKKICPGCISETVKCWKLILSRDIRGCRCAASWCDLDLTFDLAVVTLTFKILSGLYFRNCKVQKVDTWSGHWLGAVDMQYHNVTLI